MANQTWVAEIREKYQFWEDETVLRLQAQCGITDPHELDVFIAKTFKSAEQCQVSFFTMWDVVLRMSRPK